MGEFDGRIEEWINRNLCLGESTDTFFKAAVLVTLDRIATALEKISDEGLVTFPDDGTD